MARWVGPPPRLTDPPRPWNTRRVTPWLPQTSAAARLRAAGRATRLARMPPTFIESE